MIKWFKGLFRKGPVYKAPAEKKKKGLGLHTHADNIRHNVVQIEKYMAIAEDPKLSVGRREQIAELIELRQKRIQKYGIKPPETPQECIRMMDELDGR